MVVLRLQLHGVLVSSADLCVALQEDLLVVTDPVKHLHRHRDKVELFDMLMLMQ